MGIGSEVIYSPSGTYEWNAEYATSYDTTSTDYINANQTLNSGEGGSFRITKWKVLEMDEETETVKMVPMELTTGKVTLQGAQGYNNAVKLLNEACSNLYSSEGVTARSITIEDIEELYTPKAIEARNNYICTGNVKYGERYTTECTTEYSSYRNAEGEYTNRKSYPVIYERESDSIIKTAPEIAEGKEINLGLSKQTQWIERSEGTTTINGNQGAKTASTSIHPKQTYYDLGRYYSDFRTKFKNYAEGKTYESIVLLNGSSTNYWVASHCITLNDYECGFYVRYVNSGYLYAEWMCDSRNRTGGGTRPLFPVVSLSSELISGDGAGNFVVE